MNPTAPSSAPDLRVKISTLWILVMFNMAFADIIGFMNPGSLEKAMTGDVGFAITQPLLLAFSVLLEIPIAMIYLARVLRGTLSRWVNIAACVLTALFVIGARSEYLSYAFFATVEVICMLLIVWYAWRLPKQAG